MNFWDEEKPLSQPQIFVVPIVVLSNIKKISENVWRIEYLERIQLPIVTH